MSYIYNAYKQGTGEEIEIGSEIRDRDGQTWILVGVSARYIYVSKSENEGVEEVQMERARDGRTWYDRFGLSVMGD